jgi:hypothetical protein
MRNGAEIHLILLPTMSHSFFVAHFFVEVVAVAVAVAAVVANIMTIAVAVTVTVAILMMLWLVLLTRVEEYTGIEVFNIMD